MKFRFCVTRLGGRGEGIYGVLQWTRWWEREIGTQDEKEHLQDWMVPLRHLLRDYDDRMIETTSVRVRTKQPQFDVHIAKFEMF